MVSTNRNVPKNSYHQGRIQIRSCCHGSFLKWALLFCSGVHARSDAESGRGRRRTAQRTGTDRRQTERRREEGDPETNGTGQRTLGEAATGSHGTTEHVSGSKSDARIRATAMFADVYQNFSPPVYVAGSLYIQEKCSL